MRGDAVLGHVMVPGYLTLGSQPLVCEHLARIHGQHPLNSSYAALLQPAKDPESQDWIRGPIYPSDDGLGFWYRLMGTTGGPLHPGRRYTLLLVEEIGPGP
jgi:hypothetical protein